MGQYDLFRIIAQSTLTEKEREMSTIQQDILNDFESSPSFETITISGTSYGVQIVEQNSLQKNPNEKRILMKPGDVINVGDLVLWNSNYWLCTDNDPDGIYYVGIIERCNNELKWLNSLGGQESTPCITTNKSLYTTGIDENKYMVVGAGHINVIIPTTDKTLLIDRDKRFLIGYQGKYDCWKVTMADHTSQPGLIYLVMEEDEVNKNTDNLSLGIADYYNNVYTIAIKEDNVSIAPTKTVQLHAVVTKNGEIINADILWSSSNATIATVDANGLVTAKYNGDATITAIVKDNADLTDDIVLNVKNAPTNDIKLIIEGDNVITWTETQTYIARKLIDGVEQAIPFTFTVDRPDLVTLQVVDIKTCKLVANDNLLTGTVILTAKNDYDPAEVFSKTIQVIGF